MKQRENCIGRKGLWISRVLEVLERVKKEKEKRLYLKEKAHALVFGAKFGAFKVVECKANSFAFCSEDAKIKSGLASHWSSNH